MVSIATLGLYIAYALPIFFRVTTARRSFVPGPFHLGRFGVAVGSVGMLWVALVTVLFCLPVAYPVTKETLNYTPVAVGGVLVLSLAAWVLHARFWFRGPITNILLFQHTLSSTQPQPPSQVCSSSSSSFHRWPRRGRTPSSSSPT